MKKFFRKIGKGISDLFETAKRSHHTKVYWSNSKQRHHDYYVFLYRKTDGKLSFEDMAQYELAMRREQDNEVKSLADDAVSPFG